MRSSIALASLFSGFLSMAPAASAVEIDSPALFATLDANADGQLSRDEAGDAHARLFTRLLRTSDDDDNGQLTPDEFAAGLTPVRADKSLVEKQGSRTPGGDALIVAISLMDADGDLRLEAEEIPERFSDLYEQMLEPGDADKDGSLDAREIAQAGPQLGFIAQRAARRLGIDVQAELARLPEDQRQALERMDAFPRPEDILSDPEQAAQLFERLDANDDDKLAPDEAPEGLARLIERGDRDGDGQLSRREFDGMVRRMSEMAGMGGAPADSAAARRNLRQILRRFDRDGDGQLSREEAPPRIGDNFERLDADGNGQLDRDELEQAAAAQGRGQRRRPAD
jgi:Ca2+-binding EF-hand superfamily protein